MNTNLVIKLKDGKEIHGSHPLVIIGPNGAGKTTFANELAMRNRSEWIGATRNLQFNDSIVMQTPEQSRAEVANSLNQSKSNYWMLSSELNQLLAKLKSEDAESAIKFRNEHLNEIKSSPENTKIIQLTNLWNAIFTQRKIDLSSYSPKATANHRSGNQQYGISRMSNGERVALYLLARVLDAPSGLIFIDEPEIHFHSVLAKKFWNELEIFRSDCRFVYITHDLPFAISRNGVQFAIVFSETKQEILDVSNDIPDEVIQSILGAATFSVSATKIIFCEGSKLNKRDDELYSAFYQSADTAVIPVGSCEEVIKCVDVFNKNAVTKGISAVGIIDRDYRSEEFLSKISQDVRVLSVHELESIFCTKDLFIAVAKHLGKEDPESIYKNFIAQSKKFFKEQAKERNKIILERVRQRSERYLVSALNGLYTKDDISELSADYLGALKVENWSFNPEEFFKSEKDKISEILADDKNIDDFLKIFPGRDLLSKAVQSLGFAKGDDYLELIISALISGHNEALANLKKEVTEALKKYLPNFN